MRAIVLIALIATALVSSGCRSSLPDLTTGTVRYERTAPDGSKVLIQLSQPKDLQVDFLQIDPQTGTFTLTNYAAVANQGAINARQAEAREQRAAWSDGMAVSKDLIGLGLLLGSKGAIQPTPSGPLPSQGRLAPEDFEAIARLLRDALNRTEEP